MQLLISGKGDVLPSLEQITEMVKTYGTSVHLKRFDVSEREIELLYLVNFVSFDQLKILADKLRELSSNLTITYLDNQTG